MSQIVVEHHPSEDQLNKLGVSKWPTWSKEVSTFPWVFHEQEIAYILEGECVITPAGGKPVVFGKGGLGDISRRHESDVGSEKAAAQTLQTGGLCHLPGFPARKGFSVQILMLI